MLFFDVHPSGPQGRAPGPNLRNSRGAQVRDARVPFLCANPEFEAKVDKRKRVLLARDGAAVGMPGPAARVMRWRRGSCQVA